MHMGNASETFNLWYLTLGERRTTVAWQTINFL